MAKKSKGTYNLSKMQPIVSAYKDFEGTKKAFCVQYDLNPHTLDYWRNRIKALEQTDEPSFRELSAPVVLSSSVGLAAYLLHFPDGRRLELPLHTPLSVLTHLLQNS